ncbi:hypothetical protein DID88_008024 [Monilinia fructigena]|uniref:Uncharacterized protein n=1 Tax=Monilinia fructigena TaxID=38457 RepID=A0A395J526_9HELO|nr:hypothetical protein DID88_008024 [Monilinia fructigena]
MVDLGKHHKVHKAMDIPAQAARPLQEPQRYYTPSQQHEPPYQRQQSPPGGFPARNGPAPFYVVAPGQQPPQADGPNLHKPMVVNHTLANSLHSPESQQPYPQRDPTPRIASGSKPPPLQTNSPPPLQYSTQQPQTGHRPQSTYSNPQELATSVYDTPVQQQNPHPYTQYNAYKPPQQPSQPSQPLYEPSAAPSANQPPQYSAYNPPQQESQPSEPSTRTSSGSTLHSIPQQL